MRLYCPSSHRCSALFVPLCVVASLPLALSLASCADAAHGSPGSEGGVSTRTTPPPAPPSDSGSASITFSAADPHGGSAALTINAAGSGPSTTVSSSSQPRQPQQGSGSLTLTTTDPQGKSASITMSGSASGPDESGAASSVSTGDGNTGNRNGTIIQAPVSGNGSVIIRSGSSAANSGGNTMVTTNSTDNQGTIEGSNRLVTRTFALKDFDSLDISSSFQATIDQANHFEVHITADDNLVPYLQVRKEGGALFVGLNNGTSIQNAHLKVHIIMPRLASVTLSGAARGTMEGFHGDDLHAVASGASQLTGDVDAPHTTFEVSGASTVSLTGNAPNAILGASGASQLLLDGCSIQTADVTLSGAAQARLNVQQTLNYDLSGASQLRYRGEPTMQTTSVTGASSVMKE